MKKSITIITLSICLFTFSQEKFNCREMSVSHLKYKYNALNENSVKYKIKNEELIPFLLNKIFNSNATVTQICIDAWYEYDQNGLDRSYSKFVSKNKYIAKDTYKANYDYYEIFSKMADHLEKSTNYRRGY